jgi:hypothetical protein
MNLRWSHTDFVEPEIYADGISPGMGKHATWAVSQTQRTPHWGVCRIWLGGR